MKTFKQFLSEEPFENEVSILHKRPPLPFSLKRTKSYGGIGKDYEIKHKLKNIDGKPTNEFNLVHKPTNKVHLTVQTVSNHEGSHIEQWINSFEGNKIRVHEFYHHMLKNGYMKALYSDVSHSPGAKTVWQRLHSLPNIKMMVVDDNKATPVKKNWNAHYGPNNMSRFVAIYDKGNKNGKQRRPN